MENIQEAAGNQMPIKLMAVCREVNKNTGEIAVYPLCCELDNRMISLLSIRAKLNPELRYFAITVNQWVCMRDIIIRVLMKKKFTEKSLNKFGGAVEL